MAGHDANASGKLIVGTGDGALAITRVGDCPGHVHAREHGWSDGLVLGRLGGAQVLGR